MSGISESKKIIKTDLSLIKNNSRFITLYETNATFANLIDLIILNGVEINNLIEVIAVLCEQNDELTKKLTDIYLSTNDYQSSQKILNIIQKNEKNR